MFYAVTSALQASLSKQIKLLTRNAEFSFDITRRMLKING